MSEFTNRARTKIAIKGLIRGTTGLYVSRSLPRGVDVIHDIKRIMPGFDMSLIFDVGANVGQSSKPLLDGFPNAMVYGFEPVDINFRKLKHNLQNYPRAKAVKLGLSEKPGNAVISPDDVLSSIQSEGDEAQENCEEIEIDTVDRFVAREKIDRISFLKIDTEGHDLKVLRGAMQMLEDGRIDIIQVEAGMNPGNSKFIDFGEVKSKLEGFRYYMFGFYDQVNEHYTNEPHLRRVDAVFVSESVISHVRDRARKIS